MSMTSTDPISDMLTRIRNAIAVSKREISLPHSKIKEAVARLLQESNFIDSVAVSDARIGKTLTLTLNQESSNARITEIDRLRKRTGDPCRKAWTWTCHYIDQ
jgi:small subunit ribosomal protein S8